MLRYDESYNTLDEEAFCSKIVEQLTMAWIEGHETSQDSIIDFINMIGLSIDTNMEFPTIHTDHPEYYSWIKKLIKNIHFDK